VSNLQGITDHDIAQYLASNPGFFESHAELLASVQLTSPHGQRAVSLQERQMEMLRERNKGLERKIIEMIRHGQENMAINDRLHRWTRALLLVADPAELPAVALRELQHEFMIPQAAIRLWDVATVYSDAPFARAVSDDAMTFAASLTMPYCGVNNGFEAAQWLEAPSEVASMAMIPLRHGVQHGTNTAFGLLVLGSPDPTRYAADMGTEFLTRIGEVASAATARLLAL
jgi:uncharacterized protein